MHTNAPVAAKRFAAGYAGDEYQCPNESYLQRNNMS
jgi:hypothetical protein